MSQQTPEKRDEFRARPLGYELRDDGGEMPTLVGHLAVFNQWTEINSAAEGHFLERMDPGAFTKTISESRDSMRVLFQHGKDPTIGDKPLGPIRSLEEDGDGVAYEVPLLDTSYNRDIMAMLAADPPVLGSSFRFRVMRENVKRKPVPSDYNPRGLPERTVQEVRMQEFGPVTFPAYQGARAGLRSLTDRMSSRGGDDDDVAPLERMILLAVQLVEAEDEPGEMGEILEKLRGLTLAETEGGEASSENDPAPPNDAAHEEGTSHGTPRTQSWPLVPSLHALHVSQREEVSLWNRTI